jgi:adenylate cyclase
MERRARVMIKGMFSTYLTPSLVDQLVADPTKLKLGGERKELTVLFSDLEGFTTLAETKPPEELVGLLNEYLSAMTQVVLRNNGTLDKFEGDLIMAFWGAPVPQKDHAQMACLAALQMQAKLGSLRLEWGIRKRPLLSARIGLNTGDMIVGNMGSVEKFNYTVIGDSVNLGSRLEGANKIYRTEIIISESCFVHIREDFLCRELDVLSVRGRSEPVRIYELRGILGQANKKEREFVSLFEAGLQAYRSRNWSEASGLFERSLTLQPADYPSELYLDRIRAFERNPPGDGWKGIHVPQA